MIKLSKKHIEAVKWLIERYLEASNPKSKLSKQLDRAKKRNYFLKIAFRPQSSCVLCSSMECHYSCEECIHAVGIPEKEAKESRLFCMNNTYSDIYCVAEPEFMSEEYRSTLRKAFKKRAKELQGLLNTYELKTARKTK